MDTFFTFGTFTTLAGCITSVVVIMNTIRHSFSYGPRPLGLLVSIIVSIIAFTISISDSGNQFELKSIVIIILNGCLIYTSAFGVQNTVIHKINSESNGIELQDGNRTVLTNKPQWNSKW